MNIQIFGTTKCFETKKAERYFKERGIKYQFIDILRYPMSLGEFRNIKAAAGGIEPLINTKAKEYDILFIRYLASEAAKEEKLFENQGLFNTPVVRNGRKVTIGYKPEVWGLWEKEEN